MDSTSTANLSHLYPEVKGHDLDDRDRVYSSYPNKWSRFRSALSLRFLDFSVTRLLKCREYFKEPFAEFLGIFIFMTFGLSVNCQVGLSGHSEVASTPQGVCFYIDCSRNAITESIKRIPCLLALGGRLASLLLFGSPVESQALISIQL